MGRELIEWREINVNLGTSEWCRRLMKQSTPAEQLRYQAFATGSLVLTRRNVHLSRYLLLLVISNLIPFAVWPMEMHESILATRCHVF